MTNTVMDSLKRITNTTVTDNGAVAKKSTLDAVYDLFALGGAYRAHNDADCQLLFKKAYKEDPVLAIKCLFYLRDILEGQGERRFFRTCYQWLAKNDEEMATRNLIHIAEFGRYDDLIYSTLNTPIETVAFDMIAAQLKLDKDCKTPSLLAKWVPSCNASAKTTIATGNKLRKYMGLTHKEYRKMLSELRTKINIVEKLMSENRWEEIEFDKLPSIAGLKYRNAFARRDIIKKKYETFAKDTATTVNTKAMFPYEIVKSITNKIGWSNTFLGDDTERAMINKYWENIPDFLQGSDENVMCVVDTSGSMTCGGYGTRPIDVAISLGIYAAQRNTGAFANHYISFSSRPQLIECEGVDFCDMVARIYSTNLCENTNLDAVFDLLFDAVTRQGANKKDLPSRIVVISDMQIDSMAVPGWRDERGFRAWTTDNAKTNMESIREKWAAVGLELPKLYYWNVNAQNPVILDSGDDVTFVSGCSPVLFEGVCRGVTGKALCLEKLNSARYEPIH